MNAFLRILATGLGSGYSPIAPGTAGTVVGFVFYWILSPLSWAMYGLTAVAFLFFSIWVCNWVLADFTSKDPRQIVIDEVAGVFFTMAFIPFDWTTAVVGFLLFRLFDVTKPYPAGWADKNLSGGWGIVMDDIFAGIYANLALRILLYTGIIGWIDSFAH